MIIYSNHIYTEHGKVSGYITIDAGKIVSISRSKPDNTKQVNDFSDYNIIPGFIDIHIHGWGRGSFWGRGDEDSLLKMQMDLIDTGTTTFLATTGTDDLDKIKNSLQSVSKRIKEQKPSDGSQILGIHLEGPFINKAYKGLQKEEYCLEPNIEILADFIDKAGAGNIKILSLAPELYGSKNLVEYALKNGIQISAAHTAATFDQMAEAVTWGIGSVTHTYSAMRGFHHRELGVVGATMYFDQLYAEFAKQSGLTVRPEAFEIMHRLKGSVKIILSTDCTALAMVDEDFHHYVRKATFSPDGDRLLVKHDDGEQEVIDRTSYFNIKNIELGFIDSVKNLLSRGYLNLYDIIQMATYNPAKFIGVSHYKGGIALGKDADLLVLDQKFNLLKVYIQGFEKFSC